MSETLPAIVADVGSGSSKAGFAGDDGPSVVFSTLVFDPKNPGTRDAENQKSETAVVREINAVDKEDLFTCRYPIEHGIVTNWDDIELILAHCFRDLRADPEEHGILLSDPPLNPRANKERTLQLTFEAFNVAATYLASTAQLNLYAAGRCSGIVTDVGDGITSTVPFYESHCFPHAIQRQDFGGRDLTFYLQRMLHERGHSFTTTSELQLVRQMKESLCYVSNDYAVDLNSSESSLEKSFTLPDGKMVTLDKERFQCPEALFTPSLAGYSYLKGLPDLMCSSLSMCDMDVHGDMCVNLLVSGGCSMQPGFFDRLGTEVRKRIPSSMRVRVVTNSPMKYATWIGGSILGSLMTFQHMWISKEDYHEYGPSIISRQRVG